MKPGKLTNVLLALIFLALLANVAVPLLRANEAAAQSRSATSPAERAAAVGIPPAYEHMASQVTNGLGQIAQANQQIASAIREHAQSNERIAQSLQDVANNMNSSGARAAAPTTKRSPDRTAEEPDDSDPSWWKKYIEE